MYTATCNADPFLTPLVSTRPVPIIHVVVIMIRCLVLDKCSNNFQGRSWHFLQDGGPVKTDMGCLSPGWCWLKPQEAAQIISTMYKYKYIDISARYRFIYVLYYNYIVEHIMMIGFGRGLIFF